MQKVVGAFLGLLLVRVILLMMLGPTGIVYFYLSFGVMLLVCVVLYVWGIVKMHRLRRKFCDDALLYACKKRRAFDEPDFQVDELRDIRRCRQRGDFKAVNMIIASANQRLLDEKFKAERLASAQAWKQRQAEQNRPAEIRMYRA